MSNYIDSKYIGHNRKEEIIELENLSNLFVMVSEYDEDNDVLTTGTSHLPFVFLLSDIAMVILTIFFSYFILFSNLEFDKFGSNLSFNPKIIIVIFYAFFIIGILITRISNMKKLNKFELNFEKKLLTIKNSDYWGKYFIEETYFDFAEIKSFRIRRVLWKDKYFSRNRKKILVLETKDEKEHSLFVLGAARFFKFNEKRMIDLLKSILRV